MKYIIVRCETLILFLFVSCVCQSSNNIVSQQHIHFVEALTAHLTVLAHANYSPIASSAAVKAHARPAPGRVSQQRFPTFDETRSTGIGT